MNQEDRWRKYIDIEQLRELGFNKTQMANRLSISRTTLYKYMSMTPDLLQQWLEEMRTLVWTKYRKQSDYSSKIVLFILLSHLNYLVLSFPYRYLDHHIFDFREVPLVIGVLYGGPLVGHFLLF